MMLYGYGCKVLNEWGLQEMKEITLAASPDELREIASFLEKAAALMESGEFRSCSHLHISSVADDWNRRFPNKDIIVTPPPEEGNS